MKCPTPNPPEQWDVIVVGAVPGGAAASKRCAEAGLRTLVLEKWALPRDKVCSGMIMGPWAQQIIRDHFGAIPREVLVPPRVLKGHRFHLPGARPEDLAWETPLAWRKDLDAWLFQKAEAAGVEVRDRVKWIRIESDGQPVRIRIADRYGEKTLEAGWLIGADGANSAVRKSLFPEMKVGLFPPDPRMLFRFAEPGKRVLPLVLSQRPPPPPVQPQPQGGLLPDRRERDTGTARRHQPPLDRIRF